MGEKNELGIFLVTAIANFAFKASHSRCIFVLPTRPILLSKKKYGKQQKL